MSAAVVAIPRLAVQDRAGMTVDEMLEEVGRMIEAHDRAIARRQGREALAPVVDLAARRALRG